MKRPTVSTVFPAFQFLTEVMCAFFLVVGLSPSQISFQGELLGTKIGFSTGQLVPLQAGVSNIVVLAGIAGRFLTLFFSFASYFLKLGGPNVRRSRPRQRSVT